MVAYLAGSQGKDVLAVDLALEQHQAVLPPVVLCELLSAPRLPRRARTLFEQLPLLDILDDYWERAGLLRARVFAKGHKARIADARIAQPVSTMTCRSFAEIGTSTISAA